MNDSETLSDKVSRFQMYYLDLIKTAECEPNLANEKVHSKILCCSIFDAISKSVFPNIHGNRERFVELVRLCESWPESQKISLLHLVRLFEVTQNLPSNVKQLKEFSKNTFSKLFPILNGLYTENKPISLDTDIDRVLLLWPKQNGKPIKIGGVLPHQLKHENLLWLYRNSVVHEYRAPGEGVEQGRYNPEFAFYQKVTIVSSITNKEMIYSNQWELVYPASFFVELCKQAINVASAIHLKNNTCPFTAYSAGTYWIPDFNNI